MENEETFKNLLDAIKHNNITFGDVERVKKDFDCELENEMEVE